MKICELDGLQFLSAEQFQPRLWRLLFGPQAFLAHGANPAVLLDEDTLGVPPGQKLFNLWDRSAHEPQGCVLADEINPYHRRVGFHAATLPDYSRAGVARRGLLMAGAFFGDIWGFEYMFTYAVPNSPGSDLAAEMGLKVQGVLCGYSLTPEGRGDMLLMGGLWSDLRQRHKAALEQIRWGDEF